MSQAIVDVTEKGVMSENACAGRWPTDNRAQTEGGETEERKDWDGVGEDGAGDAGILEVVVVERPVERGVVRTRG